MSNHEINKDLRTIRERMVKSKQMLSRETLIKRLKDDSEMSGSFSEYDFDEDPLGYVDHFKNFPDVVNAQVARSEYFVTPENIQELESTLLIAREILFAIGKPMTAHPDYEELFEDQLSTIDHALNEFWLQIGNISASAHKAPIEDNRDRGKLLDVYANDPMGSISFTLGFDNSYDLYIQLHHPETNKFDAAYDSKGIVQEMDDREFRIIQHYINVLIQEAPDQTEHSTQS